MSRKQTPRQLNRLLLLLCLALAWLLFLEQRQNVSPPEDLSPPGKSDKAPEIAGFKAQIPPMPPIDNFSEMVERPLFSSTRRPVVAEVEAEPAPDLTKPKLALMGIVINEGERVAVLQRTDTREVLRLFADDEIDGWLLTKIESDRVFLALQDEIFRIRLEEGSVVAPPTRKPKRTKRKRGQSADKSKDKSQKTRKAPPATKPTASGQRTTPRQKR